MTRQGIQMHTRTRDQVFEGGLMDQAGALRQLRFGHARRRTQQVRVAVDEARHHHPPGGVDLQRVSRFGQIFDPPGGSHLPHYAVAH